MLRANIVVIALLLGMTGLTVAGAAPRPPAVSGKTELPVASDVRLGGDDSQTRFVVDLSQKIDMAAFTLADPYRIVIDLPQVAFKLTARTGEAGRRMVK
ncbi:MAG: AMIN domain-containing protein, partial [Pseudolabrys sp.]